MDEARLHSLLLQYGKKLTEYIGREDDDKIKKRLLHKYEELYKIGTKKVTERNLLSPVEDEINESMHNPRDVTNFLRLFAQPNLKYLTHLYDVSGDAFDREKILDSIKKDFNQRANKYILPRALWTRIHVFINGGLTDKKVWFFNNKRYSLNWSSPEVIEWSKKNPNIHPLNFEKFATEAIYPFKQSIEVKAPQLEKLIIDKAKSTLAEKYRDFYIDTFDLDKPSFYADMDKILSGISGIFESIKERHSLEKNYIKILFKKKKQGVREIRVIHVNSECDKPLTMDILKGSLSGTLKNFYQVCDWSIIAKNESKYNVLNVLSESQEVKRNGVTEEEIEGFTHIIKIYAF